MLTCDLFELVIMENFVGELAQQVVKSFVESGTVDAFVEERNGCSATKESVENILKELQSTPFLYN